MLNSEDPPSQSQMRFIRFLQKKVSIENIPQPQLEIKKSQKVFRSGLGTIDDHMLMMNNYICSCGKSVTITDHSTSVEKNGMAIDSYKLQCNNCGDNEEVNFRSLRKTLFKATNTSNTTKKFGDPTAFPYL